VTAKEGKKGSDSGTLLFGSWGWMLFGLWQLLSPGISIRGLVTGHGCQRVFCFLGGQRKPVKIYKKIQLAC